jgi:WD40 repeat protein
VTLQEFTADQADLKFLPGEAIVFGVGNSTVQLWSAHDGSKIAEIRVPSPPPKFEEDLNTWRRFDGIKSAWPSPDGSVLLIAFDSGHAGFWDPKTGEHMAWLVNGKPFNQRCHFLNFTVAGRFFAGLTADNKVNVYEMGRNLNPVASSVPLTAKCIDLTFAPDGQQILIAEEGRDLRIWNWHHDKEVMVQGRSWTRWAVFSPDSRLLAIPGDGFVFRMWDTSTGQLVAARESEFAHHPGPGHDSAYWAQFLPGGQRLLTATLLGRDKFQLWDTSTGDLAGELPIRQSFSTWRYACHSSSRICISTYHDLFETEGRTTIFDAKHGDAMTVVGGKDYVSRFMASSPDGHRMLTQTPTGEAHVWVCRRSESRHGYMGLPEFWLAATLIPVLLWSLQRDARGLSWLPAKKPIQPWKRRILTACAALGARPSDKHGPVSAFRVSGGRTGRI